MIRMGKSIRHKWVKDADSSYSLNIVPKVTEKSIRANIIEPHHALYICENKGVFQLRGSPEWGNYRVSTPPPPKKK